MNTHKWIIVSFCLLAMAINNYSQSAIFLHHSTGEGVYSEGGVATWIENYNVAHNTDYVLTQRSYPFTPYPWDNYPYDYWNLWVNNVCDNNDPDIACLSGLCAEYDVIIFKHCYPGASIVADDALPDISSSKQTLANYKLQYRALRDQMDTYSNNKFIVWTLAPLHRLATGVESAARAREFVEWVKNEWLTEDDKDHSNIYIFDFFGYVTELNPSPDSGQVNCLKYEFEVDHSNFNSHPNTKANQYVGPLFAEFIVNTIEDIPQIKVSSINVMGAEGDTIIDNTEGTLQMIADIEPTNVANNEIEWSVENITGIAIVDENGLLTAISDGIVKVIARALDGSNTSGFCFVTITSQSTRIRNSSSNDIKFSITATSNQLQINSYNEKNKFNYCSVYSIQGINIYAGKITDNVINIDIGTIPSGIYIVNLSDSQLAIPFKLIIPKD